MQSSAPVTAQGMFLPSTARAKKPRVTFAPNNQPVELKGPNHLPSKNNPISGRKGCDSTSNTPSVPNAVTITASNDMTNSHLITCKKKNRKYNELGLICPSSYPPTSIVTMLIVTIWPTTHDLPTLL